MLLESTAPRAARPRATPGPEVRVVGLGNALLKDDALGLRVAAAVAGRLTALPPRERKGRPAVDVREAEAGGFVLLDLLSGCRAVILVDAVTFDGVAPGRIMRLDPGDLHTSLRIRSVHDMDLPTVLALGKALGAPMPERVVIFVAQARDTRTFSMDLSPEVEAAVPRLTDLVLREVESLFAEGRA